MKMYKRFFVFILVLVSLLYFSYSTNKYLFKQLGSFLSHDVNVVATGSSLVANSLNPQYVPGLVNIACAAEPLSVSYYKIREICGFHPSLGTVLVSFSLPELSCRKDFFFNGNDPITYELLERLSYLYSGYDLDCLDKFELNHFRYWESFIRNRIFPNYHYWSKMLCLKDVDCPAPHIGGYLPAGKGFMVDELIDYSRWRNRFFQVRDSVCLISKIDNLFLDSIAVYCAAHDLNLIVVSMPVRHELFRQIPHGYISYHDSVLQKMHAHDFITVIDATNYLTNEYFVDHAHVNEYGAKKISRLLSSVLDSLNNSHH